MYIRGSGGVPLAGAPGNADLRLARLISLRGGYPTPAFPGGSDHHHEQARYPRRSVACVRASVAAWANGGVLIRNKLYNNVHIR
eukprot:6214704-Pleurochrysis_carterae.AAC.1